VPRPLIGGRIGKGIAMRIALMGKRLIAA